MIRQISWAGMSKIGESRLETSFGSLMMRGSAKTVRIWLLAARTLPWQSRMAPRWGSSGTKACCWSAHFSA